MNKLKIGFVLDDGLDRPGGVQQYVMGLGEWLRQKGHDVHYLVGETRRHDVGNVHSLAKNIKVSFNRNKLSIPVLSSKKKIDEVLAQNNFDVLHVQMPYSPLMAGRVIKRAARRNIAVVGTFHILPYGFLASAGSTVLSLATRCQNKYFSKVFAASEPAKSFAKAKFGIDSCVTGNFVDLSKYKPAKKDRGGATRLVFVGRLVERKGCKQLLQAIKYMKEKSLLRRKIILDICGSGPQQRELVRFCHDNNLNEVKFHGYVAEPAKIRLLAKADIAVFPALGGESFGIVLLEAMAAGCMVIAGDNPGYRSVLAELPESLINPRDTAGFARRLARAVNDTRRCKALNSTQQLLAKRFGLDEAGEQILREYCQAKRGKLRKRDA